MKWTISSAWIAFLLTATNAAVHAQYVDDDEAYAIHGQITFVEQFHPAFHSPYRGPNSFDPASRGNETTGATLYAGLRLWDGGQLYIDPELDQGFGLSNTYGIAAFPSGEAYKVGSSTPYFRLQRLFVRQVIGLGGGNESVEPDANQLGMTQAADNITITAGKFAVTDIVDANMYAHDPTTDFLNWAFLDSAAFDYAADAWSYTYGLAIEWTQNWWSLRSGVFAMSRVPNGTDLQTDFRQFELVEEGEARIDLFGRQGKFKILGFLNRARMGSYNDALKLAEAIDSIPDPALVRNYKSRAGAALNIEQPLTDDLGAFLRASFNNGDEESYEFTDVNQSLAIGLSLKGNRWARNDDVIGVALAVDGISRAARRYFAAGGLGTLIGDGRLSRYANENAGEIYYSAQATKWLAATFDYQFVDHPAYNPDRGPVSVIAVRLHASF